MAEVADDASLVRAAQAGGLAGQLAYESLVDRHGPWLVRFLKHLLGGKQADAEDVAQEVFIRAFLAIRDCRDPARFRAWLRTTARHQAFNHRRAAETRSGYHEQAGSIANVEAAGPEGPVEARQTLQRVLGGMSYPFREIMILRFVENMELREIAETLEVGVSAAKMRLQRARAEFARIHEELTKT